MLRNSEDKKVKDAVRISGLEDLAELKVWIICVVKAERDCLVASISVFP